MPFRNKQKYLYDIIDCCQFLLDFTKEKPVKPGKNSIVIFTKRIH